MYKYAIRLHICTFHIKSVYLDDEIAIALLTTAQGEINHHHINEKQRQNMSIRLLCFFETLYKVRVTTKIHLLQVDFRGIILL